MLETDDNDVTLPLRYGLESAEERVLRRCARHFSRCILVEASNTGSEGLRSCPPSFDKLRRMGIGRVDSKSNFWLVVPLKENCGCGGGGGRRARKAFRWFCTANAVSSDSPLDVTRAEFPRLLRDVRAGVPRVMEGFRDSPLNWFQGPGDSQLARGDGNGVIRAIASMPGG